MRLKTSLTGLCAAALLTSVAATVAFAQTLPDEPPKPVVSAPATLPVLLTGKDAIDVRVGNTYDKGAWTLAPEVKPDVFTLDVAAGKSETVTFISDMGAMAFTLREGQSVDFNIVKGDAVCWTRITAMRKVPAANYDAAYQKANRGKVAASIPEVYELVNIIIALTDSADKSGGLVYKNAPYYAEVQKAFAAHKNDPLVKEFDKAIKADVFAYFNLKMDGNAFVFDKSGRIVNRKEYDRTGFAGRLQNNLRPFVPELERFARESKFRDFYRAHKSLYDAECAEFVKGCDLAGMRDWLQSRFPVAKPYDFVDVVFSPLVAWNQSSTHFESNGFRTLQPHVNYPYPQDTPKRTPPLSPQAIAIDRGMIVFTEMNHGYLDAEGDKYNEAILAATDKTEGWLVEQMRRSYSGAAVFYEYMNWGLVSLWAIDAAPKDADAVARDVAMIMKRRGFSRFAEFQPFLIKTYMERKPGQGISDLYPQLIAWFAAHNQAVTEGK